VGIDGWRERLGRWELWRADRVIASVTPDPEGAQVVIDCHQAWQTVQGRAGSAAQGRRHVDRWIASRLRT
jgi:hypothetical protein